jgi:hypothetical protein
MAEHKVTIDVETATETATQPEDVERIRREAGLEEGDLPPRGVPAGASSDEGYNDDDDVDTDRSHDHDIDLALAHHIPEAEDQPVGVPDGAARDDELPPEH